ncbi:MAG: IPT/TIG domain-containing protein [Clostridiales bacterium]|nr:IPT/TIG domain-containing protein [Clostridiales bacterium]
MELKKHITDEKTEISYTLCGDYFLDDFELRLIIRAPEECRNINKVKDNAIVVVA